VTFCLLHEAFWILLFVRELLSNRSGGTHSGDGTGILGGIAYIIFGPLITAWFVIGFVAIDSVLIKLRQPESRSNLYETIPSALIAYFLVWLVLSLNVTGLAADLAQSYLQIFPRTVPWTAMLIGAVSTVLTSSFAMGVARISKRILSTRRSPSAARYTGASNGNLETTNVGLVRREPL
jgi:hypothetical protein